MSIDAEHRQSLSQLLMKSVEGWVSEMEGGKDGVTFGHTSPL